MSFKKSFFLKRSNKNSTYLLIIIFLAITFSCVINSTKDLPADTSYFLTNNSTYPVNAICVYPNIERSSKQKTDTVFISPQKTEMVATDKQGSFGYLSPQLGIQSIALWDSTFQKIIFNVPLNDSLWSRYGNFDWKYEYRN